MTPEALLGKVAAKKKKLGATAQSQPRGKTTTAAAFSDDTVLEQPQTHITIFFPTSAVILPHVQHALPRRSPVMLSDMMNSWKR